MDLSTSFNQGLFEEAKSSQFSRDFLEIRLPMEMLIEVFQCLDMVSRIRYRRTCALWNSILTGPHLGNDVRLRLTEESFSPSPDYDWSPLYAVTGCVLKCINSSTQALAITGDGTYTELGILNYIHRTLRDSRMERLILHNLIYHMGYDYSMDEAMDRFVEKYSCCRILTFQDFTMRIVVEDQGPGCMSVGGGFGRNNYPDKFDVYIAFGSINLSAPDAVIQLWDLVEKNCRSCSQERIAKWIESQQSFRETVKILDRVQSCDPRETTNYRGKEWTTEGVAELDVSKLTRITLLALTTLKAGRLQN